MRLERRRVVYGTVIGAGAFIIGVFSVWFTAPVREVSGLADWRAALWVFLDANGIVLEPTATGSALLSATAPEVPELRIGWVLPLALVALGAVLTASGVSGTSRFRYMVENGSTVLYGYLGFGLIAVAESGARPAVAGLIAIVLFLVVILYVGGTVTQKITGDLPFIGVASVGTIAALGLIFVLAGLTVIQAMLPMVVVGVSGVAAGIVLLWGVRNAPR
jgi:hypothetical protein